MLAIAWLIMPKVPRGRRTRSAEATGSSRHIRQIDTATAGLNPIVNCTELTSLFASPHRFGVVLRLRPANSPTTARTPQCHRSLSFQRITNPRQSFLAMPHCLLPSGLFLLVLAALRASAEPVTFEFTISHLEPFFGFPTDPVPDGSGYVTFDPDSFVPPGGDGFVGDSVHPLTTLSLGLSWLGEEYDMGNASLWGVNFRGGVPRSWGIGGTAQGAGCGQPFGCVQFATSDFDLGTNQDGTGFISIAVDQVPGFARGSVTWRRSDQVRVSETGGWESLICLILVACLAPLRARLLNRPDGSRSPE